MEAAKRFRCWVQRPDMGNRVQFVSELRGHGGVDWGYTDNPDKALPMTERMTKIFINEGPPRRHMQPW